MSGCGCEVEIKNKSESGVLRKLFAINFFMFVAEFGIGLAAMSTALMADSLDMLADASVYAISLFAVGKSLSRKIRAAAVSGLLQLLLGAGVLIDIFRKFISGYEPVSLLMIITAGIAFMANYYCLVLIQKHQSGEIHMRASWIFTKNDLIANAGVIFSGILVYMFHSPYPDLAAGLIISLIILQGSYKILSDSYKENRVLSAENLEEKSCG